LNTNEDISDGDENGLNQCISSVLIDINMKGLEDSYLG
jgi:hypothetical protein